MLAALLLTLVTGACDESEPLPRHTVSSIEADGSLISRPVEDIEAVERALDFSVRSAPAELGGYPLVTVHGSPGLLRPQIEYRYGSPEAIGDNRIGLARFVYVQESNTSLPVLGRGDPVEIAGQSVWINRAGQHPWIWWEAQDSLFTLRGWRASAEAMLAAAGVVIRAGESGRAP
jgi:hypothetical protein